MHSILYTNLKRGFPRNKFQKQNTSLTWQCQHVIIRTTVNLACRFECRLLDGSGNFLSEGLNSKYLGFAGHTDSITAINSAISVQKQPHTVHEMNMCSFQ